MLRQTDAVLFLWLGTHNTKAVMGISLNTS